MRIDFDDQDLERLYREADFFAARYGPDLVKAFRKKCQLLEAAQDQQELRNYASLRLEQLRGNRKGQHSIRLNAQWRLVLRFERSEDGVVVIAREIVDYH
ncbi:MAG: type II toxin-antitoxin system RelE/ParE family toxin [Candidatus Nanopelagicales bacterium]|nr:type II toxin-antitoxin system RelE/ParE family toxin [Candidatus Nanopelagicales bacterium]